VPGCPLLPFLRHSLFFALLLASVPARATQCRVIDGGSPALAAIDAEARLHWLDRRMAIDARNERIWSGVWGGLYGGVIIVQSALAATEEDTGQRAENIVGAAASAIGAGAILILPPSLERDQSWWVKHEARAPEADICARLALAEHLMIKGAASEEFGIGPLTHIGNFVINIAGGLVLGLGFNRWGAFGYVSLVGIAVGEVQVITQPTGAIQDLRRYKDGDLGDGKQAARLNWAVRPWAGRDGGGASVGFVF
jgi:hypothetical protein